MLNAVFNNLPGDTGISRQNRGSALSMSFFIDSGSNSFAPPLPFTDIADDVAELDDAADECFWNKINMANAVR